MQRMGGGRFGPLPLPPSLPSPQTPSQCTTVYAKEQFHLLYIIHVYDVLYSGSTCSTSITQLFGILPHQMLLSVHKTVWSTLVNYLLQQHYQFSAREEERSLFI